MLVCAPTGAGKTDVAMLSILRVLSQHLLPPIAGSRTPDVPRIAKDDFKIIYVAPMKALAAEVVRKFGKRLAWIGIQVRELTGASRLAYPIVDTSLMTVRRPIAIQATCSSPSKKSTTRRSSSRRLRSGMLSPANRPGRASSRRCVLWLTLLVVIVFVVVVR